MALSKLRPRRGTLKQWESSNPILKEGEIAVIIPDSGIGTGLCSFKLGDGYTDFKTLSYAINIDMSDNVVSTFDTISENYPELLPGDSESTLWGKVKKKFMYLSNAIGNLGELASYLGKTDTEDIANFIKYVNDIKINKNLLYNGLDSANPNQFLAAMAGTTLKKTTDSLQSQVTQLNGDLKGIKIIRLTASQGSFVKYDMSPGHSALAIGTNGNTICCAAASWRSAEDPLISTGILVPESYTVSTSGNSFVIHSVWVSVFTFIIM